MTDTDIAKVFMTGRSQAVRIPQKYRFDTDEVFIYRDELSGDIILTPRPKTWDGLLVALENAEVPEDFLGVRDERQSQKDPFPPLADFPL